MCINFSFNTATLASSLRLFMFDLLLSSFLIGSTLCIWSTQRMWSCWTKTRWQTLTHLYLLVHSLSWPPITNVVLLSSSFRLPTGPLCSSSEESTILNSHFVCLVTSPYSLLVNSPHFLESTLWFSSAQGITTWFPWLMGIRFSIAMILDTLGLFCIT